MVIDVAATKEKGCQVQPEDKMFGYISVCVSLCVSARPCVQKSPSGSINSQ